MWSYVSSLNLRSVIKRSYIIGTVVTSVVIVFRIEMNLPLVAIDVPFGFDVLRVIHGSGVAIAVDLEQLHRAYSLREDSAAMFHGGGLKEGGFVWARVKAAERLAPALSLSCYVKHKL